ncbi:MAG TPA: hypothetical protein VJB89_03655 [Candidatus Nanoarchaeia archaeon]|nr:hypothetical protein [Candidatus Nanoarchaeia archaeon]
MRKTTSIKIDPELWKELKIHCIKIGKDVSMFLEELIGKELKKK